MNMGKEMAMLLTVVPAAGVAQVPGSNPAVKEQVCNVIVRSEIIIDRPVKDVWPHFLDMGAWIGQLQFETIQGEKGMEGEVRRVSRKVNPTYRPYLITTVRVRPLEQYVLKVNSEEGPGLFGFTDFSFTQGGSKTHLVYDVYIEVRVPEKSDQDARSFCAAQNENTLKDVSANNRNLKMLVESGSPQ